MLMRFREIRNIGVPYKRQGQIYFTLANYKDQPQTVKNRIRELISDAAGGNCAYEAALWDWMIGGMDAQRAASEHYVRMQTLVRMRNKVYQSW